MLIVVVAGLLALALMQWISRRAQAPAPVELQCWVAGDQPGSYRTPMLSGPRTADLRLGDLLWEDAAFEFGPHARFGSDRVTLSPALGLADDGFILDAPRPATADPILVPADIVEIVEAMVPAATAPGRSIAHPASADMETDARFEASVTYH
jgi:hypothetical protein